MRKTILMLMFLGSGLIAKVVTYDPPKEIKELKLAAYPSSQYSVQVIQDEKINNVFVYMTSAQQPTTNRSLTTSWAPFSFDGKITVRVNKLNGGIGFCEVLPHRNKIIVRKFDKYVEFDITEPGQYSVEFQKGSYIDHPILIFADPLEKEIPDKNDPSVVYFGPGVYNIGDNFQLESGKTYYLAGGSYLKGRISGNHIKNVRIIGRGILSGENYPVRSAGFLVNPRYAENMLIEGITVIEAPSHNIVVPGNRIDVKMVKIMGWYFSTDGINVGSNSLIENCFVKTNDDSIRLYADNIEVRNCIIWQMENGACFQLGWGGKETVRKCYVHDCEVIRVEQDWDNVNESVFCAIKGEGGHNMDYTFENIDIYNCSWRLFHLITEPNRWAEWNPEKGNISDINFSNIRYHNTPKIPSLIKGYDEKHKVYNITFNDLYINEKKITTPDKTLFLIDPLTTSNIILK